METPLDNQVTPTESLDDHSTLPTGNSWSCQQNGATNANYVTIPSANVNNNKNYMNMNTVVNQNVVPNNAPRKAVLPSGVLFRFGFEPIPGSGLSKVGEVVFTTVPPIETLNGLQQEYCRTHSIDEPFNPADYGYGDTAE